MKYLWTEDKGAGLHFWQLVNQHLFGNSIIVESKGSNQGLLDAVRTLVPEKEDVYYIAFDKVYDNMDVVNKLLELEKQAKVYPKQIRLLDITCFEHIILSFNHLVEWTGTRRKDKIEIRRQILNALEHHRINIDEIHEQKTLNYLMGFKHYSTERVIKSLTNELTDSDDWSVKGIKMGSCWFEDCCILDNPEHSLCGARSMKGVDKIHTLLNDDETQRLIEDISV